MTEKRELNSRISKSPREAYAIPGSQLEPIAQGPISDFYGMGTLTALLLQPGQIATDEDRIRAKDEVIAYAERLVTYPENEQRLFNSLLTSITKLAPMVGENMQAALSTARDKRDGAQQKLF